MPDETNQEQAEETNLSEEQATTPEGRGDSGEEASSSAAAASPQITPEKYAELEQKVDNLLKGFNEKAREAADASAQRDYYAQIARAAVEQQQQREDPLKGIEARMREAREAYDFDTYQDLVTQYATEQARRTTKQEFENLTRNQQVSSLQEQVHVAAERFGLSRAEVSELTNRLAQNPEAFAAGLVYAKDPALLDKAREKARKTAQAAAQSAAGVNAMPGQGSGGRVPGSMNEDEEPEVNPLHWLAMPPRGRKKVYGNVRPT